MTPLSRPALLVLVLMSLLNGTITLVVLLIAPLGLASVVALSLLITANSLLCGLMGRRLMGWLEASVRTGRPSGDRGDAAPRLAPGRWPRPRS